MCGLVLLLLLRLCAIVIYAPLVHNEYANNTFSSQVKVSKMHNQCQLSVCVLVLCVVCEWQKKK